MPSLFGAWTVLADAVGHYVLDGAALCGCTAGPALVPLRAPPTRGNSNGVLLVRLCRPCDTANVNRWACTSGRVRAGGPKGKWA